MQSLLDLLSKLGATLQPAADQFTIERVVAQYDVELPAEARVLYEKANGSDGEFGEWSWVFSAIGSDEITIGSYSSSSGPFLVGDEERRIDPNKYLRFFDCLIDL